MEHIKKKPPQSTNMTERFMNSTNTVQLRKIMFSPSCVFKLYLIIFVGFHVCHIYYNLSDKI